jgi:tetratricopeptide (TPR) repeat protein
MLQRLEETAEDTEVFRRGTQRESKLGHYSIGWLNHSRKNVTVAISSRRPATSFDFRKVSVVRASPDSQMFQTKVKRLAPTVFAVAIAAAISSWCVAQTVSNSISPNQVREIITQVRTATVSEDFLSQAAVVGGSLLREGRYPEAAELFSALAVKRPNDVEIIYAQALAVFNGGRANEAEPIAQQAVTLARLKMVGNPEAAPRAADTLVLLGIVLAVRAQDDQSLKALQEAARIAPNHFDAQFALGRQLFGMGDDNGAAKAFRTAKTLQPSNPQVLFFLATALERSGEIQQALTAYRELTSLRPEMSEGHLGLGALLLKRSAVDEAVRELERALQINPDLYEAQVALGRALVISGRPGDAVPHLQRAAELAPNNPEPHYQLSLAYRRLGRKQEAANEAETVKRIHESRRGTKGAAATRAS